MGGTARICAARKPYCLVEVGGARVTGAKPESVKRWARVLDDLAKECTPDATAPHVRYHIQVTNSPGTDVTGVRVDIQPADADDAICEARRQ